LIPAAKPGLAVCGGQLQTQHGNRFLANGGLARLIVFCVVALMLHGPVGTLGQEAPVQPVGGPHSQDTSPAAAAENTENDAWMRLGLNVQDIPVASPPLSLDAPACDGASRHHARAGQMKAGGAAPPRSSPSERRLTPAVYAKWFGVFGVILLLIRHARR
jgi:hypothetical protein